MTKSYQIYSLISAPSHFADGSIDFFFFPHPTRLKGAPEADAFFSLLSLSLTVGVIKTFSFLEMRVFISKPIPPSARHYNPRGRENQENPFMRNTHKRTHWQVCVDCCCMKHLYSSATAHCFVLSFHTTDNTVLCT